LNWGGCIAKIRQDFASVFYMLGSRVEHQLCECLYYTYV